MLTGKTLKSGTELFSLEMALNNHEKVHYISRKGIYISRSHIRLQKVTENMKYFVSPKMGYRFIESEASVVS